ncbi:MAG: restriction endonuclease subunit S [Leptospiraceae bacterium]|nr:restriction endonuclease subunit S [Leptospiraceae bacterium]
MKKEFIISKNVDPNKVFLVKRSALEGRLDPLYYSVEVFGIIKNSKYELKTIKQCSTTLKSGFGAGKDYQDDVSDGVIQIRPTNLGENGTLKFDRNVLLPKELLETHSNYLLEKGDLLFNNTNSQELVGKTVFFNLDGNYFHSNHITKIKVNNNIILPEYLALILNVYQSKKIFYNICTNWNNQSGVGIELLSKLKVPIPNLKTQSKVIEKFNSAYSSKRSKEAKAKELLESIDSYLLKELGITLPPKSEAKKVFYVNFKDIQGKRFDPFYHKVEFEELEKALQNGKYEVVKLKEKSIFQSGYAFNSDSYIEESDCHLVTIKNISQNEINLNNSTYLPEEFFEKYSKFQIKNNDLLIAMTGATIGKVGLYNSYKKALLNQRVGIIKSNHFNELFLMSLLNIPIYQILILRNSNGGAQPNISEFDIMKIKIPLPPLKVQAKIAEHISGIRERARQLQKEAEAEIEKAKLEVEKMILGE